MNLYKVYVAGFSDGDSFLYVAETQDEAEKKALKDNEECYYVMGELVEEVDGYEIVLKKK